MINDHRQFLYKDGEARIFEVGEEITEGWVDSPNPDNVTKVESVVEVAEVIEKIEPEPQKYPSQMNKAELVDFGKELGLDLDMEMSKRVMRMKINGAMKDAD